MSWDSSRTGPVPGQLARHLGRLQQHLDVAGEQVREAVANAVGRSVAQAVSEAVCGVLCPRTAPSGPASACSTPYSDYSSRSRQEWDEPAWRRDADASSWRDAYAYDHYNELRSDAPEPEELSLPPDPLRARRWRRAVSAGLQAAAWWLRRHPGPVSLWAALAVGSVAGLAVLAGHISGIASLLMSALGLAYLLDLVRSASSLVGRDITP